MEFAIDSVILIFILSIFTFFVAQLYNLIFRGFAPFQPTKSKVIKNIIKELDLDEDAIIYDFGCGDANFLREVRKKYKKAKLIGIEYSLLLFTLAGIQDSFLKTDIRLKKGNFFDINIEDADMIYCFLNKKTMKGLESKFKKECKKGALIVSHRFSLSNLSSFKEIGQGKDKVYFYKM